jgi:hypothetical protein
MALITIRLPRVLWIALGLASLAAGCANIIAVDVVRSPMTPVETNRNPEMVLEQAQVVTLDTGYERTLAKGSRWKIVGTIVEGTVYQPVGADFTIQGRDPVSAFLVISNGQLIGFFVPIEEGFSPLNKKISIAFAPAPRT